MTPKKPGGWRERAGSTRAPELQPRGNAMRQFVLLLGLGLLLYIGWQLLTPARRQTLLNLAARHAWRLGLLLLGLLVLLLLAYFYPPIHLL